MISRQFAQKIFDGFSVLRWNDRVRPFDLNEMDRTAYLMILSYFIGKYEEKENCANIDWNKIINKGVFDFLKSIVLSDIKAPLYRRIKTQHPKELSELNDWVLFEWKKVIKNQQILIDFESYIKIGDGTDISSRILAAAHKYSTYREFEIIKELNPPSPTLAKIEKELLKDLEDFMDLKGIKLLLTQQNLYELMTVIEQLRFQVRWSQTPRIPRTSVLGHSFIVAVYTFMLHYDLKEKVSLCDKRFYNNFFCGLFHDLPEAVTRDIISPVKRATRELDGIVKEAERAMVREELFPLINAEFHAELEYFTQNEFNSKVMISGETTIVDCNDLNLKYNANQYSPLDGELIKASDDIAAFLEAYLSYDHGIKSSHLTDGINYIKKKYSDKPEICGIDFRYFFNEFQYP